MMFRFATWVVGTVVIYAGLTYYNSVERPDHNMTVALAQFDNSNETAKELRKKTFIENQATDMASLIWIGFTALCVYGPIARGWKDYVQNSGD